MGTPTTSATKTPIAMIMREVRAPQKTRLRTSRPRWSVPIRWLAEGAFKSSDVLIARGSYGEMRGAANAMTMNAKRNPRPTNVMIPVKVRRSSMSGQRTRPRMPRRMAGGKMAAPIAGSGPMATSEGTGLPAKVAPST